MVKALTSLLIAPQVLPFGLMGERLRQVIMTFPTSYQIIPVYPCAVDQDGKEINFLEDESWVSEAQLPLLCSAATPRPKLGTSFERPNHLDLRLRLEDHLQRAPETRRCRKNQRYCLHQPAQRRQHDLGEERRAGWHGIYPNSTTARCS